MQLQVGHYSFEFIHRQSFLSKQAGFDLTVHFKHEMIRMWAKNIGLKFEFSWGLFTRNFFSPFYSHRLMAHFIVHYCVNGDSVKNGQNGFCSVPIHPV